MEAGTGDDVAVCPGRAGHRHHPGPRAGGGEFDADDEEVGIAAGRSQFAVRTYAVDDFPGYRRRRSPVTLPVTGLADALRQVVRAASGEDTRPMLTGVLMAAEGGGLRLVATDSYRLAVRDLPGPRPL